MCGTEPLEIAYIGQKGDKNAETILRDPSIRRHSIHAGKFRRFHSLSLLRQLVNVGPNLLNLRDAVYVVMGYFEALYLLLKLKPDIIFFKGGFVVVPIGYAARLLRIPYITHDSDALPGLANRLIARGARYNAVAHEGVTCYPAGKSVVTGVPVIEQYVERVGVPQMAYKKLLSIPTQSVHLFIYTGTQGARIVDEALETSLPGIMVRYPDLYVTHVFGRLNEHTMENRYKGVAPDVSRRIRKVSFIDNAYDYIASADIVIARAGATSMAEFATIGRACIIIPAEQLTGGHQLVNARLLERAGAIMVVREAGLDSELPKAIEQLTTDVNRRRRFEQAIRSFAVSDASQRIAQLLYDTCKQGYSK